MPLESDWIARHPVTVEIAGSSPVKGAEGRHGTRIGRATNFKPWDLWVRFPPVLLGTRVGRHWDANRTVTPAPAGLAGSIPARRTEDNAARSSSGSGRQPLTLVTGVRFPHGSIEFGMRSWERGVKKSDFDSAFRTQKW